MSPAASGSTRESLYDKLLLGGLSKLVCAMVVLGLSAAVVAKTESSPIQSAAIYLVAISAFHFFPFALCIKTEERSAARPPAWYIVFLTFSAAMWASGSIAMLVIRYADPVSSGLWKRARIPIIVVTGGSDLETICTAAGAFGLVALLSCLYQWYVVIRWISTK